MNDEQNEECDCPACTGEQPSREEQETLLAELDMVGISDDFSVHKINFEWCEDCQEMHGHSPENTHLLAILNREDLLKLHASINQYVTKLVKESGPMALVQNLSRYIN